jgi:hypothetical protein
MDPFSVEPREKIRMPVRPRASHVFICRTASGSSTFTEKTPVNVSGYRATESAR